MSTSLGRRLAEAIGAKDKAAIDDLIAPEVDFKGLTPRKFWEAATPDEVAEIVFGTWFEDTDRILGVHVIDGEPVEDTEQVTYRFAIENQDGPHTVEQTAYYRAEGDRIGYLRVVCSGYRPAG
ncbi:MAG: hypothetical protein J7518_18935 [Nocardioidaceae bacterium]|nr:hypothetical protein [Nocardioidaceae bacterium]